MARKWFLKTKTKENNSFPQHHVFFRIGIAFYRNVSFLYENSGKPNGAGEMFTK